jgi:urocanate hydratase
MTERAEDLQLEALRAFTLLSSLRPEWGGALIVACGLDLGGQALSIASNIAGAGCLILDRRADACRTAMRSGACDFIVNTVDEALRILKNEIRKHKPVSVALEMDEAAALDELIDRGVSPELYSTSAEGEVAAIADRAAQRFQAFGSSIVRFRGPSGRVEADQILEEFVSRQGLTSVCFLLSNGEELRARDAELLQLVPPDDPRRRWLYTAPRFFHRERPHRRLVYLTMTEQRTIGLAPATPQQP